MPTKTIRALILELQPDECVTIQSHADLPDMAIVRAEVVGDGRRRGIETLIDKAMAKREVAGDETIGWSVHRLLQTLRGPGPIEAHCAAVTDPAPVPADADRIAARIAGQRLPVVADARRSVVIVSDHQDAVLSRDSRIGVCSKDATDEQLRDAVGLGVDMSGLPRVERKPIPGITHLQAFTVTGYTGD